MKTFEEYSEEVRKNAIDLWKKGDHTAFKNMEDDPVINLLLSALSYQAFHIQKNIEQYEENTLRNFRDRIIPFHLIKPMPAFSIVETKMIKTNDIKERIADETCVFEFKKFKFVPLLKTKIINAELRIVNPRGDNVWVELQSAYPIENLSGLSFYIDTPEPIGIESIRYGDYELPLIKPSQYNELPFTKWFNNDHLFMEQNYYLFGTYDYWQEIFLTNICQLYYIDEYDTKDIPLTGETNVELEIVLSSPVDDINGKLKINCIPVVNVEKKEITLNSRNPIQNLSSDTDDFLNLLYDKEIGEDIDSFLIRQHGVERYNPKQLLEQMREMLYRYSSDYYAFQAISELRNSDKLKKMQEVMDEISDVVNKFENEQVKGYYYAVLKKNKVESKNIYLEYLTTSGTSANGIKKTEKASKAANWLDRNNTFLLHDTQSGRNTVTSDVQKEDISKYYFQTKDRLVTQADIRIFIKSFYYNENCKLGSVIKNITMERNPDYILIIINLDVDNTLNTDKNFLAKTLQNKIMMKSASVMPFKVEIS